MKKSILSFESKSISNSKEIKGGTESHTGKGIRYVGEILRRKAGKSAAAK